MSEKLLELLSVIESKMSGLVLGHKIANGELTIKTGPESIYKLVELLGSDIDCQFGTLIDITAVDYPEKLERFLVIYHFLLLLKYSH